MVLTASCSGPHVSQKPFADLHLPYVTKVPGVEQLELQTRDRDFFGMTTYQPRADTGQPHILFGVYNTLYDVRLDGSLRSTHPACGEPITITRDGRWAACNADAVGIALLDLNEANAARPLPFLLTNDDGTYVGDPTWAPDGKHLAVFSQRWGGCAIEIYNVSLEDALASLAVVLPLPQFADHRTAHAYCRIHGLTWSPDGARFAFGGDARTMPIYTLSLATVWPLLSSKAGASSTVVTITPNMLRVVGTSDWVTVPVWGPTAGTLTFISYIGHSVEQLNLATGAKATILTQDVTNITRLSWTPDGKHLVFAFGGGNVAGEVTPAPAQLYVYSPPR